MTIFLAIFPDILLLGAHDSICQKGTIFLMYHFKNCMGNYLATGVMLQCDKCAENVCLIMIHFPILSALIYPLDNRQTNIFQMGRFRIVFLGQV